MESWFPHSRCRQLLLVLGLAAQSAFAQTTLVAVERDTGRLYSANSSTAALTLLAETGVNTWGDMAFDANGTLYAISIGSASNLFQLNIATGQSTLIGPLGDALAEGGLAIAPNGQAFAASVLQGSAGVDPFLYSVNLSTGAGTVIGQMGVFGALDINGLAWRSDGMLIGLERVSNSLVLIDPGTAAVTPLAAVPSAVGGVGGLTLDGSVGYYTTSGPLGQSAGSNLLYRFDPFTGSSELVGSLAPAVAGIGLSGLAAMPVPEPAGAVLWAAGLGVGWLAMRRRQRSSSQP